MWGRNRRRRRRRRRRRIPRTTVTTIPHYSLWTEGGRISNTLTFVFFSWARRVYTNWCTAALEAEYGPQRVIGRIANPLVINPIAAFLLFSPCRQHPDSSSSFALERRNGSAYFNT
jgi:hypothetical protein